MHPRAWQATGKGIFLENPLAEIERDLCRNGTMPALINEQGKAERAIRHIVIGRHATQGTRGKRGQRWCERVWAMIGTCRQQKRRIVEVFCEATNAHFRQKAAPSLLS